jgi:hypothetical protein
MSNLCPGIKFTWDSQETVPFLDLSITIDRTHSKRAVKIELYKKDISLNIFTDPHGDYPQRYQESWITGENIRILRVNSDRKNFEADISRFKSYLRISGYSDEIIRNHVIHNHERRNYYLSLAIIKAKQLAAIKAITQPFTPGWKEVRKTAKDLVNQVKQYIMDREPLKAKPIATTIALKRGINLSNRLNSVNNEILSMHSQQNASTNN